VKAPTPPKPKAVSLQILRRRVRAEMRMPGPDGQPRFTSDAQLARYLGVTDSHISHFLRRETRGISWELVDKLAGVFDLQIWQLFYTDAPYTWRSK
jgi:transcriptional regulator with XRE-family HTH domain